MSLFDEPLDTIAEAAPGLRLSPKSVRNLIASRKLGCLRVGPRGGRVLVARRHIDAYLANCLTPGGLRPTQSANAIRPPASPRGLSRAVRPTAPGLPPRERCGDGT